MNSKTILRVATLIVLASTIMACAVDVARLHRASSSSVSSPANQNGASDAALDRCKALGAEAAKDLDCKNAWAKSRERFFTPPASGQPPHTNSEGR